MTPPRYCIVGAGATGLAAVDALHGAGLEFDCFEAADRVGGQWHEGYDALHLITPRDSSGFTGHPMPASYPLYPSRDQMRDYILDYAAARDLARHVTFRTRVDRIAPDGRDWLVETSDGETRRYAGVVVANGHLRVPLQPELTGYSGRQLHVAAYRNTDDVAGTRVLVVGSGNSGCDIAVDCAQRTGFETTISIRKGHLFQPKTFAGKPRGELWIMRLPPRLQDYALRTMIRIAVGRPQEYGLPEPATWRLSDQKPVVNSQLLHWIHHGRIAVAPGIRGAGGLEVEFTDGRRAAFDTIIWCTGYRVEFPFLDHGLLQWQDGVPLRTAGCILPKRGPGRLYFVGLAAPRGPQLPVYSRQAALVARMVRLQERLVTPLAETFTSHGAAEARIDIVRSIWQRQMEQAEDVVTRLEAGDRAS
jgi:cation diffusion facilitator CzcD-associated flavoprotein CzcO